MSTSTSTTNRKRKKKETNKKDEGGFIHLSYFRMNGEYKEDRRGVINIILLVVTVASGEDVLVHLDHGVELDVQEVL
jgi:hypothetical protein